MVIGGRAATVTRNGRDAFLRVRFFPVEELADRLESVAGDLHWVVSCSVSGQTRFARLDYVSTLSTASRASCSLTFAPWMKKTFAFSARATNGNTAAANAKSVAAMRRQNAAPFVEFGSFLCAVNYTKRRISWAAKQELRNASLAKASVHRVWALSWTMGGWMGEGIYSDRERTDCRSMDVAYPLP